MLSVMNKHIQPSLTISWMRTHYVNIHWVINKIGFIIIIIIIIIIIRMPDVS